MTAKTTVCHKPGHRVLYLLDYSRRCTSAIRRSTSTVRPAGRAGRLPCERRRPSRPAATSAGCGRARGNRLPRCWSVPMRRSSRRVSGRAVATAGTHWAKASIHEIRTVICSNLCVILERGGRFSGLIESNAPLRLVLHRPTHDNGDVVAAPIVQSVLQQVLAHLLGGRHGS